MWDKRNHPQRGILEINTELKGFVVKSLEVYRILGDKCYIRLENEEIYYVYANNQTGETLDLSYNDFVVGDKITVDIKSVENRYALASRIQPITQRIEYNGNLQSIQETSRLHVKGTSLPINRWRGLPFVSEGINR